jgi:UDP-N-acetylglucosamine 2-epimerase (non-hydrolysing)
MKDVFFEELGVRQPDLQIEIKNNSIGSTLSSIFLGVEKELSENRPDAVVILGDTNSSLSVIIAKRMRIPVYHLEAGNRSFDPNVPEEINRKLVDHCSDFNLVYSEHARRNLLAEGVSPRTICLIGSPMREVINQNLDSIQSSKITKKLGLQKNEFFVVSAHRQENIDSQDRLAKLIMLLNEIGNNFDLPIIVSTHPRIKDKLKDEGINKFRERIKYLHTNTMNKYKQTDDGELIQRQGLYNLSFEIDDLYQDLLMFIDNIGMLTKKMDDPMKSFGDYSD